MSTFFRLACGSLVKTRSGRHIVQFRANLDIAGEIRPVILFISRNNSSDPLRRGDYVLSLRAKDSGDDDAVSRWFFNSFAQRDERDVINSPVGIQFFPTAISSEFHHQICGDGAKT